MTRPTLSTSPPASDIAFAVQGYVTDPKRVGYQILTNYESMYWRALAGNDAWSLYEVLRSFCHEGHNTCHPSIRLLTAMLGFEDKRAIIGRVKTVKQKEYQYPGLIDILQEHKLVIAELQGTGSQVNYVFHVNLTPGLLLDEQLARLPAVLQQKHAELMERCQTEQKTLEAKRKPFRFQNSKKNSSGEAVIGGGNFPPGMGNSHGEDGKFPPEQYPYNNTHITPDPAREKINNNTSGQHDPKHDVVVVLAGQGIAEKVAKRLAERYSKERVDEKIEYLAFLQAEQPDKVQNPRGWLRRAIEENYGPPDGFVSQAEQERVAAEQAHTTQVALVLAREVGLAHQEEQARKQAHTQAYRAWLNHTYGTAEQDFAFWAQALPELELAFSLHKELFQRFIQPAAILKVTETDVRLGFENEAVADQLTHPGTKKLMERTLSMVAGRKVQVSYEIILERELGVPVTATYR